MSHMAEFHEMLFLVETTEIFLKDQRNNYVASCSSGLLALIIDTLSHTKRQILAFQAKASCEYARSKF